MHRLETDAIVQAHLEESDSENESIDTPRAIESQVTLEKSDEESASSSDTSSDV